MSQPGGLVCPDCGHHNAPGAAFCESCEVFLDWEQADPGGGRGAGTPAGAAVPGPALAQPVTEGSAVSGPPVPGPPATGAAAPAAGPLPEPPAAGPVPGAPAARTVPADPRPEAPAPLPVRPQAPAPGSAPADPARPPTPTGPGAAGTLRRPGERSADPDDLPAPGTADPAATAPRPAAPAHDLRCPACAQANARTRTLCVRCGAVLTAHAAEEERLSWWARLLRRLRRRQPRRLAAGERRPARTRRRPRLAIPLALIVLLGGGYVARPHLGTLINTIRGRTAQPTPVNPNVAEASSQLKDHRPSLAFDGANNTYWAPAPAGSGAGQRLEARFEQPFTLEKLIIHTGISVHKDEFLKQARPSVLDVELGGTNGETETKRLTLEDKPGPQTLDLHGTNIRSVRFTVRSSYGAEGKSRHTAILEVEFFGLR